jgi:hypothetical protein
MLRSLGERSQEEKGQEEEYLTGTDLFSKDQNKTVMLDQNCSENQEPLLTVDLKVGPNKEGGNPDQCGDQEPEISIVWNHESFLFVST